MGWDLAPHVSFCVASDKVVFLDVHADRYFALPPRMTAAFRDWLGAKGCVPSEPEAVTMLAAAGLLRPSVSAAVPTPVALDVPTRSLSKGSSPAPMLAALPAWGAVHASLFRMRWRLRTGGLHHLITRARASRPAHPLPPQAAARAFQYGRGPRALEGDCLAASFAMLDFLHRRRSDARAVFGVIADPFRAHCWLQSDTEILNDDADHVRAFTPILVL